MKHISYLLLVGLFVIQLPACRTPSGLARGLDINGNLFRIKPAGSAHPSSVNTPGYSYASISGAKGANVRQGPGTSHTVIGSLSSGASVKILSKQRNWYNIEATINGRSRVGWVYAPLIRVSTVAGVPGQANFPNAKPSQSNIIYLGYTKDFLPFKQLLASGELDSLSARISSASGEQGNSFWKQDDEFLRSIEYGTIMLDKNETADAIKNYSHAEKVKEERESSSHLSELVQSSGGWLGEVFGNGGLEPYLGEGYEKVLMLNYLSIAHLLDGKRKAYNVARRSIDWQNIEKKAFDIRTSKAKEKLREQNAEQSAGVSGSSNSAQRGISSVFEALNSKAKSVPSAFVNPFGYYVTGMIQEYESYQDRSLRDNARISYKKALELNPSSKVLKQAVKELKRKSPPSGKRLLHVVVADGFVPEKKVLVHDFYFSGIKIPIKIPIYQPSESKVGRIEIQTTGGRRLARLSSVANVEALCIRHQKDSEVFRNLRVALAFTSTAVEKTFLSQLGSIGTWIGEYHDQYKSPDTRSWMTLPATIQAARIHLSNNISKVRLVTFSKSGRVLAKKILKLSRNKPNFIYARSMDKTLYARTAKPLWIADAF